MLFGPARMIYYFLENLGNIPRPGSTGSWSDHEAEVSRFGLDTQTAIASLQSGRRCTCACGYGQSRYLSPPSMRARRWISPEVGRVHASALVSFRRPHIPWLDLKHHDTIA